MQTPRGCKPLLAITMLLLLDSAKTQFNLIRNRASFCDPIQDLMLFLAGADYGRWLRTCAADLIAVETIRVQVLCFPRRIEKQEWGSEGRDCFDLGAGRAP